MSNFIPPTWNEELLDVLKQHRVTFGPRVDANGNPATLSTVTPRSQEWLDGRATFAAQWEALKAQGLEQGWLEHDYCGDCDGAILVTTDTQVRTVSPNPAYKPTPLPDGATITIPRA